MSGVLSRLAFLLLGVAACARPATEPLRPTPAPATSQALRVYRDPVTGAFGEPPPGAVQPPAPQAPARAALTEEAAPGGGRMIRLRGAFRSNMVGRAGASGATASCTTTAGAP
jgi:hypothetical protein